MDTDIRVVEGMTLRNRIEHDKRDAKRTGKKLGPAYWKKIKAQHMPVDHPLASLVVLDATQDVASELRKACDIARSTNTNLRSRRPLRQWMQTVVSINQREFIGLLKYVLETRPASSASSLGLVMDFAKFSARLGVKDVSPSETLYAVKLIDEGLELQYCQLKRENVTTAFFLGIT
jgi:hypothetical protein